MLFEHYCLLTKKHTGWCYSLRITDFDTIIQNMAALKNAFQHTNVVQYVNFFPCEWNNDKGYMQKLFTYAVKHHIGLGNPDTVPYRQGQMMNSYPFFHKYRKELSLTAVATQEPDYTYINPKTGRTFTVPDLYGFAKNYLGADTEVTHCRKGDFLI